MTHPTFSHQSPILRQLSAEWQHRTIRAADLRHVRTWDMPGDNVASLDEMLDRCGYVHRVGDGVLVDRRTRHDPVLEADHDAYILHLLVIARTDELAGRIVLQRILPALSAIARRRAGSDRLLHDLLDDLIANAWATIRTYPIERRPQRVVANLVRDIGFQTLVRPSRRLNANEIPTTHDRMGDVEATVATSPLSEMTELLHEAHRSGVLSDADLDLIAQLINLGRPEHLAAVRDVSPRTVRNHRDAIVHRLRHLAAAA